MDARVSTLDYDRFDVSPTRGFVPDTDPLRSFGPDAHPYLQTFDELADTLPQRLENDTLRATVRDMQDPPAGLLDDLSHEQLLRLYTVSGFLANAYVHKLDGPSVDSIPRGVAIPLYESTARLDRTPVLSYDGYVLYNWARLDDDRGFTPPNLETLTNFVTLQDERWFVAVHVAIESTAGPALGAIGDAQAGVRDDDAERVQEAIERMEAALSRLEGILGRMPERNAPENYGRTFRHYLKPLTEVEYEGVPELDGPQSYRGASGAQSSLLPALDAALGIDHGDNPLVSHLLTLRRDMPPAHRAFIEAVGDGPSIRDYVAAGDETLRLAYNDCLERMVAFRDLHIDIVEQYLTVPLGETTGTGGTPYGAYLKMFTQDTRQTLL
jgi:indoleamine 2,3-dioxygenase